MAKKKAKKKTKRSKRQIYAELETDHSFSWALDQMKLGHTVRRKAWQNDQKEGAGTCHMIFVGEFVLLVPEQELPPIPKDDPKDALSPRGHFAHHSGKRWLGAHFIRGNCNGVWEPGWQPSMGDMTAMDWGPGFRDMEHLFREADAKSQTGRRFKERVAAAPTP